MNMLMHSRTRLGPGGNTGWVASGFERGLPAADQKPLVMSETLVNYRCFPNLAANRL
jgi:hypothetical protein